MSSATPRHSISIHLFGTDFSVRYPIDIFTVLRNLTRLVEDVPLWAPAEVGEGAGPLETRDPPGLSHDWVTVMRLFWAAADT